MSGDTPMGADADSHARYRLSLLVPSQCVVALADQWYLKYGEPEWQSTVRKHIESTLELYSPQTKSSFMLIVEWLHEWACRYDATQIKHAHACRALPSAGSAAHPLSPSLLLLLAAARTVSARSFRGTRST